VQVVVGPASFLLFDPCPSRIERDSMGNCCGGEADEQQQAVGLKPQLAFQGEVRTRMNVAM
jgi:hypothetical protein